jgi:hypothetical protein
MSTLIACINIAGAIVGTMAATISLADTLVRHRTGHRC